MTSCEKKIIQIKKRFDLLMEDSMLPADAIKKLGIFMINTPDQFTPKVAVEIFYQYLMLKL